MLGVAVVCGSELVSSKNLLPWPGATEAWVYTDDTRILRVDGPFEQPGVLSVVAILAFFLIVYLWRLMPQRISLWRALLHKVGALASFTAALIPMNRGLIFALMPIALIDTCSRDRLISRRIWAAIFGMTLIAYSCSKAALSPAL